MRKKSFKVLHFAGILLLISCGSSENQTRSGISGALQEIMADKLLDDVKILSADDMEGRGAGTAGEEKAATYLVERYRRIGLQPVNGSYFQALKMVGMRRIEGTSNLSIHGGTHKLSFVPEKSLTYWSTAQKEEVDTDKAPLLFVGYGVQAPEYQWDDFKGEDVSGKVLLFLNDDPPVTEEGRELFGGEARTYYGRWTYKFEQAMRLGAAGALMIHTTPSASYPFSVVQHSGQEESFALDLPESGYQVDLVGWMDESVSEQVAAAMGTDLKSLFRMAADRNFRPVDTGFKVTAHIETAIRKVESKNVLGLLKGADPEVGHQVVVFSAHYDHLGRNDSVEGEDKIFNGAWDNAAGTASILGLAEAFAALQEPPRRSILFLACAAEESGSLGSNWFVSDPPFERRRLVANFNIDMPQIFGITSDLAAIGVNTNSLGDDLRQVAAGYSVVNREGQELPVKVTGDPNPRAGSFYRSDQVNFAKAGIPALFINPGKRFVETLSVDPQEYEDAHYHQVTDEVNEHWNLKGLARDLQIVFETALKVANAEEIPRWKPGNEFEEEWKSLHAREGEGETGRD